MDIIIVNYKSTNFLQDCLRSIYNNRNGIEVKIYVFDNGSDDNIDRVESAFSETTFYKHENNLGYAKAMNRVLENTHSPYAVFLNPDTIIKDGFLGSAKSFMDNNPDAGILGPEILDPGGCVQGSARTFPTFRSALAGRTSLISRMFPKNPITRAHILSNNSDGKTPMKVDWVSGACMVARRETLDKVGFFDERFFLYWEDVDLCKRVADGGWKVVYYPSATVVHAVGGSSERNLVRSVFEFHKSAYLYLMKHYESYRLILKPLIIIGLSFRFCAVLLMHMIRRMLTKIHNKSKTILNALSDPPN